MVVTYKEYVDIKQSFFNKHDNDFIVDTSPIDEYGVYYKTYSFEDGAVWYERMGPERVEEDIVVKKANIRVEIDMFKTEFWSSDDSESKYYYVQY